MAALIDIILPVFIIIGIGYTAVWRGFFSEQGADALMRFSQNFAIPFLLFRAISTLDLSAGLEYRLLISFYLGSSLNFILGMFGARYMFKRPWQDSVAIGFTALFANSVLLGLPIMERAFGPDSLGPNYTIIAFHAAFAYFIGISTMETVKNRGGGFVKSLRAVLKAMFRNALMIGIALGFIVNLSGFILPMPLTSALDIMIRAALPTALFALGGVLYRYRPEGDMKEVVWVITLSLMLHPLVAYIMTTKVFDLPIGMVRGAVLTAAMAPGVNSFIFASLYGRGQRVAATAVLLGTFASIFTVSFWLLVLKI